MEAALALLDEGGSAALGIRGVASRLGVQPNALYTYVADRAALERAIAERVLSLGDVSVLADPGRGWRDRVVDYGTGLRAALLAHPAAAGLLMTAPMDGPTAVTVGELLMAAMEEAGLSPDDGARATYLLIVTVIGSVALEVAETDGRAPIAPEAARVAGRRAAFDQVPAEYLPRTAAAAAVMAAWIGGEQFRWSLDTVLDGIAARGSDGQAPASRATGTTPDRSESA